MLTFSLFKNYITAKEKKTAFYIKYAYIDTRGIKLNGMA